MREKRKREEREEKRNIKRKNKTIRENSKTNK